MRGTALDLLAGRVAVVTGGASGIGRATCIRMARSGANVAVVDVDQAGLDQTVCEASAARGSVDVQGIRADVRDESAMCAAVNAVRERYGRIDILVHCAGVLRSNEGGLQILRDTSASDYDFVVDINLKGTLVANRAVLRSMLDQRSGTIVNVSSTSGKVGRGFDAVYCATKFGVLGITESLAEEVRNFGIRVLAVLPDAIDTPMWEQNGPIKAPEGAIAPDRVAREIEYLVALPPDTVIKDLVVAPFRQGRRKAGSGVASGVSTTVGDPSGARSDDSDLAGQVAIVTGGTRGLGRATCFRLAEAGASVVVVSRSAAAVKQTVADIQAAHADSAVMGLAADVTVETDVESMVRQVLDRFGRIDVLTHFAGVLRTTGMLRPLVDTSIADCDRILDTNLKGTFLCDRAVLPTMIKQKSGQIVNVSSTSGVVGRAYDSPYCASKFGVVGMTEALGQEVHRYGVRTFVVLPDVFKTPIWEQNGPLRAPDYALAPERLADVVHHLLTLPGDTVVGRVAVGPLKNRRLRTPDPDRNRAGR